jgi:hypothetical protein
MSKWDNFTSNREIFVPLRHEYVPLRHRHYDYSGMCVIIGSVIERFNIELCVVSLAIV